MAEIRIPISHVVELVAHLAHPSTGHHMDVTRAIALLSVAKGKAATMAKVRALIPGPGTSKMSDDEVLRQIATQVANGMMEVRLHIEPAKKSKIKFATLLKNYPTNQKYPTTIATKPNIWDLVGGKVLVNATTKDPDNPGSMIFVNSCATRISRALNYSGAPVQHSQNTVSGSDHMWYLFRVRTLEPVMRDLFGAPTVLDLRTWRQEISGKTGVVQFSAAWRNATGHFALWDGSGLVNREADDNDADDPAVNGVQFYEVP